MAQANAAQAQAHAATDTLITLRQQIYSQGVLAHNVIDVAIKSALRNVEFWQQQVAGEFALAVTSKRLPTPVILTPLNDSQVLDSAGRLSREIANTLSSAFDELNAVRQKIEGMSRLNERGLSYVDCPKEIRELSALLGHAKQTLQRCQTDLYAIPKDDPSTLRL